MCALPKGFIKNIKILKDKVGFDRRLGRRRSA